MVLLLVINESCVHVGEGDSPSCVLSNKIKVLLYGCIRYVVVYMVYGFIHYVWMYRYGYNHVCIYMYVHIYIWLMRVYMVNAGIYG